MVQRLRSRYAIVLGTSLMLASGPCAGHVQGDAVKAAYIYNIALFTTWPESVVWTSHFGVCATPETPLWDGLQKLNGKPVNGKPWVMLDLASAAPGECRMVILSGAVSVPAPDAVATALVIDDGSVQGASTAAITLVNEHQHIRFDVDTRKAACSGLTFSSKLLRLARNVS